MALEEIANSVDDHLLEGLSFKLKAGCSYVQSRRSVTFFPQGGNAYSSRGVRVIKISLTGSQGEWLDPSTLVVSYKVVNDDRGGSKQLRFLSGPWCLFRRMRVMAGGTILEDCSEFARMSELFHMLGSVAKRENASTLGFNTNTANRLYSLDRKDPLSYDPDDYLGILYEKRVCFTPMSGICSCDKYSPLRYLGNLT